MVYRIRRPAFQSIIPPPPIAIWLNCRNFWQRFFVNNSRIKTLLQNDVTTYLILTPRLQRYPCIGNSRFGHLRIVYSKIPWAAQYLLCLQLGIREPVPICWDDVALSKGIFLIYFLLKYLQHPFIYLQKCNALLNCKAILVFACKIRTYIPFGPTTFAGRDVFFWNTTLLAWQGHIFDTNRIYCWFPRILKRKWFFVAGLATELWIGSVSSSYTFDVSCSQITRSLEYPAKGFNSVFVFLLFYNKKY